MNFEHNAGTSTASLRDRRDDTPPYHALFSQKAHNSDLGQDRTSSAHSLGHLLPRLDALLMVLKTCTGRICTHPWETLHPLKDVNNLSDALDKKFDHFYEEKVERVEFEKCEKGYILESEGAVWDGRGYMFDEGG